eukprot:m.72097 g.72097  ORF g.72097 m.72097 type:complete len:391 (+) comp8370_c2_seq1:85-1257(+)
MNRVGCYFKGHVKLMKKDVPSLDGLPAGTCIIRGIYTTICGSDMGRIHHPLNIDNCDGGSVHEVVGEVVEIYKPNEDHYGHPKVEIGDIVLAMPSNYMQTGIYRGFDEQTIADLKTIPPTGGMSDFFLSHTTHVFKIPKTEPAIPLPFFTVAQPLGTLLWMVRKLPNILFKDVIILGGGQNGLLLTSVLSNLGARRVIVIDLMEKRLEAAKKMRATHVFRGGCPDEELVEKVCEVIPDGADFVFEMVGQQDKTLNLCIELAKEGGTVIGYGVPSKPTYGDFPFSRIFRKNISLVGSVFPRTQEDFGMAVEWLAQGRIDVKNLIHHPFYDFTEFDKAFQDTMHSKGEVLKVIIKIGDEEPQYGIKPVIDKDDEDHEELTSNHEEHDDVHCL